MHIYKYTRTFVLMAPAPSIPMFKNSYIVPEAEDVAVYMYALSEEEDPRSLLQPVYVEM